MAVEKARLRAGQTKHKRWGNEKRRARLAARRKKARMRRQHESWDIMPSTSPEREQ